MRAMRSSSHAVAALIVGPGSWKMGCTFDVCEIFVKYWIVTSCMLAGVGEGPVEGADTVEVATAEGVGGGLDCGGGQVQSGEKS